jgi:internalin A
MADIGRADLVLVLLSDEYLHSVYCMRELLHLFNTSLGDRDRLMQRMVPLVVGGLKCDSVCDRDPYVAYWKKSTQPWTRVSRSASGRAWVGLIGKRG